MEKIAYKLVCRESNKFTERIDTLLGNYIVANTKKPFFNNGCHHGERVSTSIEYRDALDKTDKFGLLRIVSSPACSGFDFTARLRSTSYAFGESTKVMDTTETFHFRIVATNGIYRVYDTRRFVEADPDKMVDVTPTGKSECDIVEEFLLDTAQYPWTFEDLRAALDKAETEWHDAKSVRGGQRLMLLDGECYIVNKK